MSPEKRRNLFFLLFVMGCGAAAALTNYGGVGLIDPEDTASLIASIVHGTADSPYRYRILVPQIIQGLSTLVNPDGVSGLAVAWFAYWILVYQLLFLAIYRILRIWFSPFLSLVGILVMAVSVQVTIDGTFQPWTVLEAGLYALAILAIYYKKNTALLIVLIVATINRETGCFILLFYCAQQIRMRWPFMDRKAWAWSTVYGVTWFALFVGLRLWLGPAHNAASIAEAFANNIEPYHLVSFGLRASLFLGAYWIMVIAGWKTAPDFIRRAWMVAPIYLAFIMVFGVWREVRLLMPLYAILIPTGLGFLAKISYFNHPPAVSRPK